MLMGYIFWNPSRIAFYLPFIGYPVRWYGLLFALGFIFAYLVFIRMIYRELLFASCWHASHVFSWEKLRERLQTRSLLATKIKKTVYAPPPFSDEQLSAAIRETLHQDEYLDPSLMLDPTFIARTKRERNNLNRLHHEGKSALNRLMLSYLWKDCIRTLFEEAIRISDRLLWWVVLATILGARLGFILFYDLDYFMEHPWQTIKIWEGGLSSHGGIIAILLALTLFHRTFHHGKENERLPFSLITLFDLLTIPALIAASFIRFGNFFNQEIIGTPSSLPWAVLFASPMEVPFSPISRHPVQLYEAFGYLFVATLLSYLFYRGWDQKKGFLFSLCFLLTFSWRFLMEFLKESQGGIFENELLQTGQWLSLPLILLPLLFFLIQSKSAENGLKCMKKSS